MTGLRRLVARPTVLTHMRSIENAVRAISREDGIELGTPSRKDFAPRVREMAGGRPGLMATLEPLLAVLASMIEQLARLTKQVLDIVRNEATCRQLMTSPPPRPAGRVPSRDRIDGLLTIDASARSPR